MNVVAVVIIKYEQVVIACTGWYDEATGLIGEDLALFSVLHYGGKAMMVRRPESSRCGKESRSESIATDFVPLTGRLLSSSEGSYEIGRGAL